MSIAPIPVGPVSIKPDIVTPLTETQEPAPPSSHGFTPLWLVAQGPSAHAFELLDIRMPSASGDVAALLAEISLTLEQSIDESRKNAGLASLANLAAALAQYDLETLGRKKDNKQKAVDDAKNTLSYVEGKMGPLLQQQAAETQKIANFNVQIASLQTQLQNPNLTKEQRAALEAQLATVQSGKATALATREGIDIQLANLRIESLERQVADLEDQLNRADQGSDEFNEIKAVLDAKKDQLADARSDLSTFQNGPKTEAARNAFSSAVRQQIEAETQDLRDRIPGYETKLNEAKAALENGTFLAIVTAAQVNAAFSADQANIVNENALRDSGIERSFELIAEGLKEAEEQARKALNSLTSGQLTANEAQEAGQRVRQIGNALLSTVANLIATLADLAATALPEPLPPPTIANRVRLEI